MRSLFLHPKKVYFALSALALIGFVLAQFLPVSLFPNSSKPEYYINVSLVNLTHSDFYNEYGDGFRESLKKLEGIDHVTVEGSANNLSYDLEFKWGVDAKKAEREIQTAVESFRPRVPLEMQDLISYGKNSFNNAKYVASISSPDGQLSTLKKLLEPLLVGPLKALDGVESVGFHDPNWTNVYITIDPESAATYHIDIFRLNKYIDSVITPISPGRLTLKDESYQILIKNRVKDFSELEELDLGPLGKPGLRLKDIAKVELRNSLSGSKIFKTDGKASLILVVEPTDDADLKALFANINNHLKTSFSKWPAGVSYRVLLDPGIFINAAVKDVYESMLFGGIFAVLILLLFVGSFKLTMFSAIEIPISMLLAFILMYFFGVGINLVSLGGLALAAGMNVDASVVMVENILRHFELSLKTGKSRIDIILDAVNEVKWPIISSTLASVIVFLPLSMTSGITYAILGDLAKAVVFSHVFSAVVAIILVPTIRLQMMNDSHETNRVSQAFNIYYDRFVNLYKRALGFLLYSQKRRVGFVGLIFLLVFSVTALLLPKIKKEIIAIPSTDLLYISTSIQKSEDTEEVSALLEPYEKMLRDELAQYVEFTFTQIHSKDSAGIIAKLKSKRDMDAAISAIDKKLVSTPLVQFRIFPWNPSKLPLPNPPDFSVMISGKENARIEYAEVLLRELKGTHHFSWVGNSVRRNTQIVLNPDFNILNALSANHGPSFSDLGLLVSTSVRELGIGLLKNGEDTKFVYLTFPDNWFATSEDFASLPVLAGEYVLPLSALTEIKIDDVVTGMLIKDDQEVTQVYAYYNHDSKKKKEALNLSVKQLIADVEKPKDIQVTVEDSNVEINKSLKGLMWAFLISLALIASIIYWQFESILDVITVKAAIPLGFIGVALSLFIFKSTLSINSLLGVILLSGIAVNNSILLVAFFKDLRRQGHPLIESAIESAGVRLRPILITSLTTILAMAPIALGWGAGAEVLQPLGIAVSFGMIFSTGLTLFVIPCLEVIFARKNV
ncbi:MAG: efflux RND transporter permease subunit [Pseudomonadota bacterium]|nr:efflux RND transporter permease subunit [Pseudomonadota bacterium]